MSAICQHRGYPITVDGEKGTAKQFRCAYHYWAYGLDGQLVAAPEMTRTCPIAELRAETRLPRLKVEIWHGMIFANMDPGARRSRRRWPSWSRRWPPTTSAT